ncbi:Rpn family recombination-promoting nuclease/putative transposase [Paenibacillus koleovorans]|uniref:Rpn family recombination-promoting nuclease/putative transposase n=1 Tax=Paenibacillus koleovorans TaxID=121608 RepID=UPI000FD7ECBC|nr:Rpn family recombination-promoting nuclease/putative transposase [Paenibacillus koleovorans]
MAVDHDRLFKELLQTFFGEFIHLFFPQAYEAIDFDQLKFLSEEVFTDVTAGERRRVDLLVETRLREEDVLILVHVEPQAYYQKLFAERMFIYSTRLYEKYRRRIMPIAIFSYDTPRHEPSSFGWGFSFLEVLRYHFFSVELKKCNWREYIRQDNPVAAALLSKMGYTEEEKVQVKLEFLKMLVRMELDPARMQMIAGFFHNYLVLNEAEEQTLREEIRMLDRKVEDIVHNNLDYYWDKATLQRGVEQGMEEGLEKGIEQGLVQGKLEEARRIIGKFLEARFGEAGVRMTDQVAAIDDLTQLERMADSLFMVNRLEEAEQLIAEASSK